MLEKLPPGLQQLTAHIEEHPPIRELKVAIASILAVGTLAIGLHPHDGEQLAAAAERSACTDVHCAPQPGEELRLVVPDGLPPSPIAVRRPETSKPKRSAVAQPAAVEASVVERTRHEPLRGFLENRLNHVPTLAELAVEFPAHYADWQAQLAYINQLDKQTDVSVPGYNSFQFDNQFVGAFAHSSQSYKKHIDPKMIVLHWTVNRYPAGDEGGALFAEGLRHAGMSSNYFVPHDGAKVYRYFESDRHMSAGALGMNRFGVNVELEAGRLQPEAAAPQVVYDVTPAALEKMVYTVVQLARQNNLAINEYTVMGHLAGDLLFANDEYDARTGKTKTLRKFDMPQELVEVVIKKARLIDAQAAIR